MRIPYTKLKEATICKNPYMESVWSFIRGVHFGVQRKGINEENEKAPYAVHLFRVLELCLNALDGKDFEEKIQNEKNLALLSATLLHDVMEDTDINTPRLLYKALEKRVPDESLMKAIRIVEELTNPPFEGKNDFEHAINKMRWQVQHAKTMSYEAKVIKIADQVANVIDSVDYPPKTWSKSRKFFYLRKAEKVTASCLEGGFSDKEQRTLKRMHKISKKAYWYAKLKLNGKIPANAKFYKNQAKRFQILNLILKKEFGKTK